MHDSISGGDRIRTVHSWRLNLVLLDSFPDSQVWRSPLRAGIGRKRRAIRAGVVTIAQHGKRQNGMM